MEFFSDNDGCSRSTQNSFNAMLALYVIGYQITICVDWSWIPMNKEDYQLPYQDKWSVNQQ